MRILITNDDGIDAAQLLPLIRACRAWGEVTAVVPLLEQSGKSHGIEFTVPFRVEQRQLDAETVVYGIGSTPADCVRFALFGLGLSFDFVISGINRGLNIGTDMLYSGTVAAVREAALHGIPAMALSTDPAYYAEALTHLPQIAEYFEQRGLWKLHGAYNVNIPAAPKGIRITRQGGPYYSDTFDAVGDGMYQAVGKCVYTPGGDPALDTDSVMNGYISVMPLTIDMTERSVFCRLSGQQD